MKLCRNIGKLKQTQIMMIKTAVIGSMLLAVTLSAYVTDLNNNLIEYDLEDVQPMQTFSLPYPYQGNHNQHHVLIKPAPMYTHENIIVPTTEVEVSSPGLVSSAVSCALQAVKSAITFLLSNLPGLTAGTAVALGVCKLTSLCGSELTIVEVQRELRSIATPERIASVTDFVKEAVRKYTDMQRST